MTQTKGTSTLILWLTCYFMDGLLSGYIWECLADGITAVEVAWRDYDFVIGVHSPA